MSNALPEGWRVVRLLDVVSMPSGQVDPTRAPFRDQVLLAPDHIESGTGRIVKKETADDQSAISGKYQVEPGDIAYSKIRPALRKAALVDFCGTCSADMYPLRSSGDIDGSFLLAVILGEEFSAFASSVSGRSGIPKVNRVEMGEYTFALPPLTEQRNIAGILDSLDWASRSCEAVIAKLENVRRGMIGSLLSGWRSWIMKNVGSCFNVSSGITLSAERAPKGSAYPYLRVANIKRGFIDFSDVAKLQASASECYFYSLQPGDLMIVEGHANPNEIGRCALVRKVPSGVLYQNHLFRLRGEELDPRFSEMWLNSHIARRYWWANCSTSSGLNTINSKQLKALPVAVPPEEEQQRIVSIIEAHDERIAAERARLEKLRKLKAGLMDDLLTGRVRVDQLKDLPV